MKASPQKNMPSTEWKTADKNQTWLKESENGQKDMQIKMVQKQVCFVAPVGFVKLFFLPKAAAVSNGSKWFMISYVVRPYLTDSINKVFLKKSITTQIRRRILYISNDNGSVNEFVRELTFVKRLCKHFMWDK